MIRENNKPTFEVKKTTELTDAEVEEINELFNLTFEKNIEKSRTTSEFKQKFLNNFLKFSFHGLMKFQNKIIGSYHVIPYEFSFFTKKNYLDNQ